MRFPIQKNLMLMILDKIADYFEMRGQPYHAKLHKAIISAGYYGLFRTGELTSETHLILAANVYLARNKKKVRFTLKTSKTHSHGDFPQKVSIINMNAKLCHCLYAIIRDYLNARLKRRNDSEPFSCFQR